ncbi:MAG: PilZ domain-containing protein [Bdellovibrionales bacterium]|nr:PilZ domain-containing protein [Bdellovibrionales bacterium]
MKKSKKRKGKRKPVSLIEVCEITSMSHYIVIAETGSVINASSSGLLIEIHRKDFLTEDLKGTLNLDHLIGQEIAFFIPQMNIDLDGSIARTEHRGNGIFHIGFQFSQNIPEYWRECLIDLLPSGAHSFDNVL